MEHERNATISSVAASADVSIAIVSEPPAPTRLSANAGVAQVTLDWDLVAGAAGYLVHRAPSPDGPFAVVDHHGMDVLAVPQPPYADTTGTPGERAWYAVSTIQEATRSGPLSAPVEAAPRRATAWTPVVDIRVDAAAEGRQMPRPWEPMIGSERLLVTDPIRFSPVNDSVLGATLLLTGMASVPGRVEALSSWVASDHLGEPGRPPRLIHGGFGLRAVGDLPKPRSHALALLARLGRTELPAGIAGDGAGSLVQAWAGRDGDRVTALVWNGTRDESKVDSAGRAAAGSRALERRVRLELDGLPDGPVELVVTRLAPGEGDLAAAAKELGVGDWPEDDATWAALAEESAMPTERTYADVSRGRLEVQLELPMPAAVLVEVRLAG